MKSKLPLMKATAFIMVTFSIFLFAETHGSPEKSGRKTIPEQSNPNDLDKKTVEVLLQHLGSVSTDTKKLIQKQTDEINEKLNETQKNLLVRSCNRFLGEMTTQKNTNVEKIEKQNGKDISVGIVSNFCETFLKTYYSHLFKPKPETKLEEILPALLEEEQRKQ